MLKGYVKRIIYLELYVANIVQAVNFYKEAFCFNVIQENRYENENKVSVILFQENITLILTSPKRHSGEISEQINLYGDFVKDIALEVHSLDITHSKALKAGFVSVIAPHETQFQGKKVKKSIISSFGNMQHTLIEGSEIDEFKFSDSSQSLIEDIDHIAIAVDDLAAWTNLYEQGLEFHSFFEETIETKYSGMNSIVMNSQNNIIKFVFVSPKKAIHKSQIEKYLDYNNDTSGVQHLAFSTRNILDTITKLKKNNIEFLNISDDYYHNLSVELKENFKDSIENIKDLKILVDKDESGYLLQSFTKPLQTRPTFFCEIIQRHGATSFGRNNIMALFEALEKQLAG